MITYLLLLIWLEEAARRSNYDTSCTGTTFTTTVCRPYILQYVYDTVLEEFFQILLWNVLENKERLTHLYDNTVCNTTR